MSNSTSTRVVCRLLGGSGHTTLRAVPADKIPALLRPPLAHQLADVVALRIQPLPLAA